MNILNAEKVFVVVPELAVKIGVNEAIFLQQLHYQLQGSCMERDGFKWLYRSLRAWAEEFPFWSFDTVKRIVMKLEKQGLIVSTSEYNKLKMDRTKWYRIHYAEIENLLGEVGALAQNSESENVSFDVQLCPDGTWEMDADDCGDVPTCEEGNLHQPIQKDVRKKKKNIVDFVDTVREVVDYLNEKANKHFRVESKPTQRLIKGRLKEGYTVEDFKKVIDLKVSEWLYHPEMNKYLRPDTLFNATKFENYLNEGDIPEKQVQEEVPDYEPLELDYCAGED